MLIESQDSHILWHSGFFGKSFPALWFISGDFMIEYSENYRISLIDASLHLSYWATLGYKQKYLDNWQAPEGIQVREMWKEVTESVSEQGWCRSELIGFMLGRRTKLSQIFTFTLRNLDSLAIGKHQVNWSCTWILNFFYVNVSLVNLTKFIDPFSE